MGITSAYSVYLYNIVTDISESNPMHFFKGVVSCKCKYPRSQISNYSLKTLTTKIRLDDISIVIEGVKEISTMDITEIRNFTRERNIVMEGYATCIGNDTVKLSSVVFVNSIEK